MADEQKTFGDASIGDWLKFGGSLAGAGAKVAGAFSGSGPQFGPSAAGYTPSALPQTQPDSSSMEKLYKMLMGGANVRNR